ncbi:MAG: glycosyltransferase family 4 protein [Fimbriimonadaceae bacterium]|nr:glycosyltransferase family 4 protein [Chthonomonadaceae bacterium]MCO5297710.1 glycosyltransferase family 4 protein [Fimbriimonadaceae bacterium]
MRSLLLTRQNWGGIARYAEDLAEALGACDVEAAAVDATDWMPNETGPKFDKHVSKRLVDTARGFDVVHAVGYRTAWACSAAFGDKRPWIYTAYDLPKTRHPLFVGRLNDSAAGLCSARAVRKALDDILVMNLETVVIGVRQPHQALDRDQARAALELPTGGSVVAGAGRWVPDRGFDALVRSMESVWESEPDTTLVLAGGGPEKDELSRLAAESRQPERVRLLGLVDDPAVVMAAADIFVVPSRRGGTSMAAMEAMASGLPVLLRDTGGLAELIDPDLSGMLFDTDEQLGSTIVEMLGLPLTLETLGGAAKVAAAERFRIDRNAERVAEVYRSVTP